VHNAGIVLKFNICAENATTQTAHLFFCQREMPTLKKNKRAVSANAEIITNIKIILSSIFLSCSIKLN